MPIFLDALLPRVIDGSEGGAAFGVGFCTIVTLVPEITLVSSRTLAFFFSAGNIYLFLFPRH